MISLLLVLSLAISQDDYPELREEEPMPDDMPVDLFRQNELEERYLVLIVAPWGPLTSDGKEPDEGNGPLGVGFSPIFDSREDAEKHFPGRQIIEVTEQARGKEE